MNPQKSPRRPEGKASSSPIWNPQIGPRGTRIGRLKTPGFQSLLFAPYHFLFIFTFFWIGILIRTPGHLGPQKLPQRPGGELVWLLSCNHFTSKNPRYPFRTRSPKEIFSTLFLFFTLHRCFSGDHSRPKDPSWPPDFVLGLVYESATNTQ